MQDEFDFFSFMFILNFSKLINNGLLSESGRDSLQILISFRFGLVLKYLIVTL